MAGPLLLMVIVACLSWTRVVCGDDDHGANVVTYDLDTFTAGLKGNRNFVMFYAPWCGHCKNLAPTWNELANIYNNADASPIVIAKVDCTVHTGLCADHEVVGFPTLKMFDRGGENHKRYTGKRDLESLKAFIEEHLNGEDIQALENSKQQVVAEPKTSLIILTDDNFRDHVHKGSFFIKFYAPWCGHCQKLAPTWDDLANTFNHNDKVNIAKIDCTQSTVICKEYGIGGYPTLLWFTDGVKIDQYQGQRSHDDLKRFVSDRLLAETNGVHRQDEEKVPEASQDSNSEVAVTDLTDETFKLHISSGLHFIKFYAPWCGHCKRLAPAWDDLGKKFQQQPVSIARVDCTQHKATCEDHQVRGYPTLKLFRDGQFVKDYRGGRTLEDLQEFVMNHLQDNHDEL